jgi:hypothetical protein
MYRENQDYRCSSINKCSKMMRLRRSQLRNKTTSNYCYRDLNDELAALGYERISHSFDIWHMIKVCTFYLNRWED